MGDPYKGKLAGHALMMGGRSHAEWPFRKDLPYSAVPTMGSLFAGIGGFDLGFERAGFRTVWQVEKSAYCRRVLRRHFPDASRRVTDVRFAGTRNLAPVDVICGGFPCQDISNAGLRAGIDGERSGLWREMHRIIGELRPRFVVVENVAALLGRGISRVLGDFSEIGYDAEWQVISAADVGAPHLRERIWIVANDTQHGRRQGRPWGSDSSREGQSEHPLQVADADAERWDRRTRVFGSQRWIESANCSEELAYSSSVGREGSRELIFGSYPAETGKGKANHALPISVGDQWSAEPNVGRVAHGIPARVDRLRALGNAVVPQIPELIARRLIEVLQARNPEA